MVDEYYYEYEQDSYYCYPGTYILKNKLGIIEQEELKRAEREITSLRMAQLMQKSIPGKFDFEHLKKIHCFLFDNIYEWAKKIRSVNISKGNQFYRSEFIDEQMKNIFKKLKAEQYLSGLDRDKMASKLAFYLGEINAIHPYRKGNGRTQRMFIEQLASYNGYQLDFAKISSEEMMEASLQTFNLEYSYMTELILRALSKKE